MDEEWLGCQIGRLLIEMAKLRRHAAELEKAKDAEIKRLSEAIAAMAQDIRPKPTGAE
jgi:hypothetical protein